MSQTQSQYLKHNGPSVTTQKAFETMRTPIRSTRPATGGDSSEKNGGLNPTAFWRPDDQRETTRLMLSELPSFMGMVQTVDTASEFITKTGVMVSNTGRRAEFEAACDKFGYKNPNDHTESEDEDELFGSPYRAHVLVETCVPWESEAQDVLSPVYSETPLLRACLQVRPESEMVRWYQSITDPSTLHMSPESQKVDTIQQEPVIVSWTLTDRLDAKYYPLLEFCNLTPTEEMTANYEAFCLAKFVEDGRTPEQAAILHSQERIRYSNELQLWTDRQVGSTDKDYTTHPLFARCSNDWDFRNYVSIIPTEAVQYQSKSCTPLEKVMQYVVTLPHLVNTWYELRTNPTTVKLFRDNWSRATETLTDAAHEKASSHVTNMLTPGGSWEWWFGISHTKSNVPGKKNVCHHDVDALRTQISTSGQIKAITAVAGVFYATGLLCYDTAGTRSIMMAQYMDAVVVPLFHVKSGKASPAAIANLNGIRSSTHSNPGTQIVGGAKVYAWDCFSSVILKNEKFLRLSGWDPVLHYPLMKPDCEIEGNKLSKYIEADSLPVRINGVTAQKFTNGIRALYDHKASEKSTSWQQVRSIQEASRIMPPHCKGPASSGAATVSFVDKRNDDSVMRIFVNAIDGVVRNVPGARQRFGDLTHEAEQISLVNHRRAGGASPLEHHEKLKYVMSSIQELLFNLNDSNPDHADPVPHVNQTPTQTQTQTQGALETGVGSQIRRSNGESQLHFDMRSIGLEFQASGKIKPICWREWFRLESLYSNTHQATLSKVKPSKWCCANCASVFCARIKNYLPTTPPASIIRGMSDEVLSTHFPDKMKKRVRDVDGLDTDITVMPTAGGLYDSRFGNRNSGAGTCIARPAKQ